MLNNLASVNQFRGDRAAAAPLIREALDAIEHHVAATAVVLTEQDQIALAHAQRFYLDNYLSCLLEIGDSADDAYRAVLNWKGATLVRQRAAREASAEEDLAPLFSELQCQHQRLRRGRGASDQRGGGEGSDQIVDLNAPVHGQLGLLGNQVEG